MTESVYTLVTYIYGLIDPRNGNLMYVGKSNNPTLRLGGHRKDPLKNPRKRNWIFELKSQSLDPIIRIFEICALEKWEQREIFWINKFLSEGCDLFNLNKGGGGTYVCMERTRNAIKESLAKSEAQKAKKGRPLRESWRIAISESRISEKSVRQLKAIQEAKIGVARPSHVREKISLSLKISPKAILSRKAESIKRIGMPQSPQQKYGLHQYSLRKRLFKYAGFSEPEARKFASSHHYIA